MDTTVLQGAVRSIRDRARRVRFYSPAAADQLLEAANEVDAALQQTLEREAPAEPDSCEQRSDAEQAEGGTAFNNIWCYRSMPHPLYDDE